MTPQEIVNNCVKIIDSVDLPCKLSNGHSLRKCNASTYELKRPDLNPNTAGYTIDFVIVDKKDKKDDLIIEYNFEHSVGVRIFLSPEKIEIRDKTYTDYETFIQSNPNYNFLEVLKEFQT